MGVADSITLDVPGKCSGASVAVGGLTPKATAAPSVVAALVDERLSEEAIHNAAAAVTNDLGDDILGDIHASADYRREMAPVMVARAVEQAAKRAGWLSKVGEWVSDLVS